LLLVLAAGGLRWYSVQTERAAVAAAVARAVDAEAQADAPSFDPLTTSPATPGRATSLPHERPAQELQRPAQSSLGLQPQNGLGLQALEALGKSPPDGGAMTRRHRLERDVAVVEVTLPATAEQPALRQTRVYRYTGVDWQHTAPSAAQWGAPRQWRGEYLIIRYYAHNIEVVAEAATWLDARYGELHQLFLGEPPRRPLTVVVDPAQFPGQIATRASVAEPLVVASPAVYLAPANISDAELLAESLLLALLDDLKAQALLRYDNAASAQELAQRARVQQLLQGVALWQLWQDELPLAAWREPLVQWDMSDARVRKPSPGEVVPSFHTALCAMHRLWLSTPLALRIPLACDDGWDTRAYYLAWRLTHAPPLRLAQFPLVTPEMALHLYDSLSVHPAATVALATVLEYAAATYGPERIPLLVVETGRHDGWAPLIPAVFGVSADGFEAGWRAYLAGQYNITPSPVD
jgi:hypothetical protein